MPTDLKLDSDSHDIDISSGTVELITENTEAVGQRLKIALLTKRGEYVINTSAGLPYNQSFFKYKNSKGTIDSTIVSYIENIEDVNSVVSYASEINVADRILLVDVSVETDDGELVTISTGS